MFDELVQYSDENGSSNLYSTIQTDVGSDSIGMAGRVHYLFGSLPPSSSAVELTTTLTG